MRQVPSSTSSQYCLPTVAVFHKKFILSANPKTHQHRSRIAFVTGCLKLGGSTTFLINLCGALVRRGWVVEVISLEAHNPLSADFSAQCISVTCLDEKEYIFEDRIRAALLRLSSFRPSYVVATLGPSAFEILRYVPQHVVTLGMGQSDDPQVYRLLKLYRGFFKACVVVSQCMAKTLDLTDITHYIPYGIPLPIWSPKIRNEGPLRILYLGRLEKPQKRVQLLPVIFQELLKSGIVFDWTIAGDGPELAYLKAAMPSQIGRIVTFLGKVDYRDVHELLRQQDIYLLASDFEGLPLSLLEAMASGLVPVVSNLPSGIPEVVNELTGYTVDVDKPEAYAAAIVRLARSPQEMMRKSVAARQIMEQNFSVEKMTDRWIELLHRFESLEGAWPRKYNIKPPLTCSQPLYYSIVARCLRRAFRRFC